MKNKSYVVPFVLITVGAIFLLNNIIPDLNIWNLLSDWWPVLLIVVGLIRIAEVLATYRTRPFAVPSRPMGLGWIAIVVLIGLAITIPKHFHHDWNIGPIRAGAVDVFGEQFNYPITRVTPAGSAKRVVLDNIRGNVTVTGSNVNEVRLDGQKIVRAYDKGSADTVNNQSQITFVHEGDALFIRSAQASVHDQARLTVDLEITVPRGVSIEARGRTGDLTINSIEGGVDVSSQRGEIRLQDIGGNAKVEVEHCELVKASKVQGTVDVQGRGKDIQLENVTGQVTISGTFSGTLDFANLVKPLHFESENTDMRVEKVPGTINMDLKELRGTNLMGPIKLVTHSRDVHLEDFAGPVNIELGSGDVELVPAHSQKLAKVDVRLRNGNITMARPGSREFALKATAQQGDVTNDFGDGISSENQGRTNTLHSVKASGADLSLTTERGEVSVRKLED